MKSSVLTERLIFKFKVFLIEEEKSPATIDKYMRDINKFYEYLSADKQLTKEKIVKYKAYLGQQYKTTSVNSMLVALNSFMDFIELSKFKVKLFKVQRRLFAKQNKEMTKSDYEKLLQAALSQKNQRLYVLLQAICSTGIRVSEHSYITLNAVKEGYTIINNKGKERTIFFPKPLRKLLIDYCKNQGITKGSIFVTRTGKPLDRSNIWSMMKNLCHDAGVDKQKVFPHNLRHLFALTYYRLEKDLVRLADLLGHSSIETTRIYTMTTGNEYEKQLTRMNLVHIRC